LPRIASQIIEHLAGANTMPHDPPQRRRPARKHPDTPNRLMLGYETSHGGRFGFTRNEEPSTPTSPVYHDGDDHVLVFAPTGRGKGVSLAIPSLITYDGPAVVVDVKGEAYQVTADRRRAMGQQVYVIDPFHVVTESSDGLNPLDLFKLPGATHDADAEMLAQFLWSEKPSNDAFWPDTAIPLVAGCIAHVASAEHIEARSLNRVREMLRADDVDYNLAVLLDTKKAGCRFAHEEFASYLQICSDKTRPCVLAEARTCLRALCSESAAAVLEKSSFDWKAFVAGEPMTIYLVLPPSKLDSHRALIRLWIGSLMLALSRRKAMSKRRTLFLLDEAAQLGELPILRQFFTLMRGYGVQVMALYQDLSQLKLLFPKDWMTILNNAGVLATFGFANYFMAKEWGEIFGLDTAELMTMPTSEMVLRTPAAPARFVRRLNYLTDSIFQQPGLYRPNPRFGGPNQKPKEKE
jgi:type IV secretion system protein VirD4